MPEYSQIQTYIKCDQSNIKEIMLDFIIALNDCGIKDAEIISVFSELEWEIDEDGRPWEALIQNDLDNIWMFDAAIINKGNMNY
ncbi:hypothetical protein [Paenibacillus maysiensis]|uniref:hypothetical protein n=1 Tax=Paenibacillus maysiensis TaxID=1155954 RepID=UPI00046EDD45|nr:hypothetical protein [Paenibacillus maysiensis]